MKDGPRIYVIYFLIGVKMKKIVFLFFTLSGICAAFAQKPGEPFPDSLGKSKADSTVKTPNTFIRLFPNPTKNKVEIEVNGFEPGFVQVQITDNNAKTVRNDKRLLLNGNETVVMMFSLQPGIYFIAVKQKGKMVRSKLMVQ